MEDIDDRHNWE